jgi:NAD-dependent deacetylase
MMDHTTSINVVVLTGAGISAESGIKTFRDSDGLWENHNIEDVATPEAFMSNPELVYRFYNARRAQIQLPSVQPNAAHRALATLERHLGDQLLLVTQNVDDLHERGGSSHVLHMHGELLSARCSDSGHRTRWTDNFDGKTSCPCCKNNTLRPDIVWFGEMPLYMDTIYDALMRADVFIAIGTSGNVYPAAGFVQVAKESGAKTIEANLEPGVSNALFDESREGLASQTVPTLVDELIRTYAL